MSTNQLSQPTTSRKQKIVLIIFGLLLFLILLEISLRLGGFIFLSIQEHRNMVSLRQKGAYRILCLGESTTAGGESPWPNQLEQILNERDTVIKFSVINKGIPAVNTTEILKQLEANLDRYMPDMVIAMIGINDGMDFFYKHAYAEKNLLFLKSLRLYKLANLLQRHIVSKAKEKGINKSEQSLRKAIELNPKNDLAYIGLAWFYIERAKFDQAEELLKKAIELNSKNDDAYKGLGCVYADQEKFALAEKFFKKAIELNPENADANSSLGWLYFDQKKYALSEQSFKKAIELSPKNEFTYRSLAWFYIERAKFDQAEELLKKAIEINPISHHQYMKLGWLYITQGKYTQAEELFKKAIELNPRNDVVYAGLGLLYKEKLCRTDAERYYSIADKLRSNSYNLITCRNYQQIKETLDKRGIQLVCVQYPMRSATALKKIFEGRQGIIFVDNENIFKEAVARASYKEYFTDMFAGDFGHCTPKGNRLLAENIANVILKEYFREKGDVSIFLKK